MSTPTSPVVHFIRYNDGSVSRLETDADAPPQPIDGTFITEGEYNTELAEIQAAIDAHAAQIRDQEQQAARQDYDALIAAGLPEAVSLRLSGYTPPPEPGAE